MNKRSKWTRSLILVPAAALCTVTLQTTPAAAGVASGVVNTGSSLPANIRAASNTASQVLRTVAAGTRIGINCYQHGQSVSGPWGASDIWDAVDGGGFIADALLYTGSNAPVVPPCTATPGRTVGQTRPGNAGVPGQCTWGAYEQFRAATGVYPALTGNAKDWANSARATGWSVVLDAEPRSIVVFQPGVQGADRTYGHVGWVQSVESRPDGRWVTVLEMNGTAGPGRWDTRTMKDVVGMSYILAP